ncbi:hypothetical protein PROFUN_05432 [Planoprotostelium fungivorum]|uniref:Uncharacterized protein n=1 Tax=Planoprotostelium fungivorum TaxID=1890364 RepID=A0A2P6NQQ9_9EUKA|nr:hypothetical protein PROFUN_05432 [Planoprotostelium fungivorum]
MNTRLALLLTVCVAAAVSQGSTLTLRNNCASTIRVCSTYGGYVYDLAPGQNKTDQPSGPYNECNSAQAEVTLNGYDNQDCYDISEVAYKLNGSPLTVYSSATAATLTCESSPCADASQPGGTPKVTCVAGPTSVFVQWC